MLKSMTGYGRGEAAAGGMTLAVEIKSVNHRYGDVTVKSPRALYPLETEIKKKVAEKLRRGKIDVFITQEFAAGGTAAPLLNRGLADAYVRVFEEMRQAYGLEGGIPLSLLASQRDVLVLREEALAEGEVEKALFVALEQALEAMEKMRLAEGGATSRDLEGRLVTVEELLSAVETRAPEVPREWRGKLAERLSRLEKEFEVDPQRLAQELALFADRCDISEELTRFRSHLGQVRGLFDSAEPVGRQLDFLLQELNRETNTMGSKSNDAELTRMVVTIKAELEKVREQIQNIE